MHSNIVQFASSMLEEGKLITSTVQSMLEVCSSVLEEGKLITSTVPKP